MMKTNRQSEKKGKKFRNLLFWAGFLICIFPVISNIVDGKRQGIGPRHIHEVVSDQGKQGI